MGCDGQGGGGGDVWWCCCASGLTVRPGLPLPASDWSNYLSGCCLTARGSTQACFPKGLHVCASNAVCLSAHSCLRARPGLIGGEGGTAGGLDVAVADRVGSRLAFGEADPHLTGVRDAVPSRLPKAPAISAHVPASASELLSRPFAEVNVAPVTPPLPPPLLLLLTLLW